MKHKKPSRKIILASASPQRRKLMKLTGLKFIVKPSRVRETETLKGSCASFVKHNALLKARDIAQKSPNAIVIGADTIVYLGGKKIIGKPRHILEAKRTLKVLCRQPQWVYTGLAVIDTKTQKTIVDYEKTKVYMSPLTPQEIDRYYQLISPLDKAGGFDIEGKGSLFIRRIEGCYFNVVGLPVAKLCQMLKKVGVYVLSLFFMVNILGCVTEYNLATQRQETLMYGTDKEVNIGENVARQFEKEFKIDSDLSLNQRVKDIGRRIAQVCDRQDILYTVKIIDDDEKLNAVSLPGGFIYIFKKLIDEVESDDQLAAVIAHEVGHITAKHSIKKLQSLYGYTLLKVLAMQTRDADAVTGVDAAFASMFMAYSLEDEYEADRLGIKYLKAAGYDPNAMTGLLKKLRLLQEKEPLREYSYWRTHPHLSQRIAAANQEATGRLEFRDYINITGEK